MQSVTGWLRARWWPTLTLRAGVTWPAAWCSLHLESVHRELVSGHRTGPALRQAVTPVDVFDLSVCLSVCSLVCLCPLETYFRAQDGACTAPGCDFCRFTICLSVCLSVCLPVCSLACLCVLWEPTSRHWTPRCDFCRCLRFVCLSVCLLACLFVPSGHLLQGTGRGPHCARLCLL